MFHVIPYKKIVFLPWVIFQCLFSLSREVILFFFSKYLAPPVCQPLVTANEMFVTNMNSLDPHSSPINRCREFSHRVDEEPEARRWKDFPGIMRVHALGSQGSNPGSLAF